MNKRAQELASSVSAEVSKVIIGKQEQLKLIMAAILARGHILLEDLPGVGKTTLVKCLSKVLGCDSKRIQFTPDLLPSDIIGMNIFDRATSGFRLLKGPVDTNLLLADELNRAIPRTQSALLEAMEERQITIDGNTYSLPAPFCVLATQNPVESESTFRLPAAQTDRFLICISLGYPSKEEEIKMLRAAASGILPEELETLTNAEELTELSAAVADGVKVSDDAASYMVALTGATRESADLRLGASPRATKALYSISKCLAAVSGRDYVIPDDICALAVPVLCHRFILSSRAAIEGKTAESIMKSITDNTPVPPLTSELFDEKP